MKLTSDSIDIQLNGESELVVTTHLAADAPGEVRLQVLLDPNRGVSFFEDHAHSTVAAMEVPVNVSPSTQSFFFTLRGALRGPGSIPVIVRFDPTGGIEPDEIYREIELPRADD